MFLQDALLVRDRWLKGELVVRKAFVLKKDGSTAIERRGYGFHCHCGHIDIRIRRRRG